MDPPGFVSKSLGTTSSPNTVGFFTILCAFNKTGAHQLPLSWPIRATLGTGVQLVCFFSNVGTDRLLFFPFDFGKGAPRNSTKLILKAMFACQMNSIKFSKGGDCNNQQIMQTSDFPDIKFGLQTPTSIRVTHFSSLTGGNRNPCRLVLCGLKNGRVSTM